MTLDNGLKLTLIEKKDTEYNAINLKVAVGSNHNPIEFLGLAHFTEHALFLGSRRYPNKTGIDSFMEKMGSHGLPNASTGDNYTEYDFHWMTSKDSDEFSELIDRLISMMSEPLLDDTALRKELSAVDDEFSPRKQEDPARMRFIHQREAMNQKHPSSRFSAGNHQTLVDVPESKGLNVTLAMRDWHHFYYQPHAMNIAILTNMSINTVDDIVRHKFEEWKNVPVTPVPQFHVDYVSDMKHNLYNYGELSKVIYVESTIPWFTMMWVIPSQSHEMDPLFFMCHMLGREGENSILDVLKKKELARSFNAASMAIDEKQTQVSIDIEPTKLGVEKWHEMVLVVFQYLKLILALPEDDLKSQLEAIWAPYEFELESFKGDLCLDPFCISHSVQLITSNMLTQPPSEWINHNEDVGELDPVMLKTVVKELKPNNFLVHLLSPDFTRLVETEPHTGAVYNVSKIDPAFLERLASPGETENLSAMVKANKYLVKESVEKSGRGFDWKYPKMIDSVGNFSECWFKGGSKHNELKGYITLHLMTSIPNESAMDRVGISEELILETRLVTYHEIPIKVLFILCCQLQLKVKSVQNWPMQKQLCLTVQWLVVGHSPALIFPALIFTSMGPTQKRPKF